MPAVPSPTLGSKRESPSVLLGPPARRHRPIGVESPSADSPQTTARDPPAPTSISIQSILRQNCRMRLYVQPIAWTSTHLRLLELRFLPVKREGREQTQPPSGNINGTPDSTVDDIALRSQEQKRFDVPDMIVAVDRLRSRYLESKKYTTREILAHCNIHLESECVPFYFDGKPVANLRTDGIFWSHISSPCLAYIAFPTIEQLRMRLWWKREHALEPRDQSEDPYIAAVLIALAQAQRRRQQKMLRENDATGATRNQACKLDAKTPSRLPQPNPAPSSSPNTGIQNSSHSSKVQIVAIVNAVADILYVYSANIPAEYLDKFDRPSEASPSCPVEITRCGITLTSPNLLPLLHRQVCPGSCKFCVDVPSEPSLRATKPDSRSDKKSKSDARSSKKSKPDARSNKKAKPDARGSKKASRDAR